MADDTQSTSLDVFHLNNHSPDLRRLTASENVGLGDLIEQLINRVNALLAQAQAGSWVQMSATGNGAIPTLKGT